MAKVGDVFKVSFPGAGTGTGAKYEVYHVSGTAKNVPSTEQIVYLKLISRQFYQLGLPFVASVPSDKLGEFFEPSFK